jgi:hypothetical protein
LATETQPDETLHKLMDAEQQRQRTDDQFARRVHPTQRLNANAGNHDARGEVSLG